MRVEAVTGDSPEPLLRAFYACWESAQLQREPGRPADGFEYVRSELRHEHRNRPERHWVALGDDGEPLAIGSCWWPLLDNTHRLDGSVELHPRCQDAAVFHALVAEWIPLARQEGRSLIGLESLEGSHESALVAGLGATVGQREQHNVLDLATVDRAALARELADAAARAERDGYRLVEWEGGCPDDWLDRYAEAIDIMNTAPRGDLALTDFAFTPERAREDERVHAAKGRSLWVAGAEHVGTGELVAFTELLVGDDRPHRIDQENTAVAPPHRGHGLGYWLKAMLLSRVLEERPQAQTIQTWNATENEWMIAVNRRLGFVHERTWEFSEAPLARIEAALAAPVG